MARETEIPLRGDQQAGIVRGVRPVATEALPLLDWWVQDVTLQLLAHPGVADEADVVV